MQLKRIISFCLYGEERIYLDGAIANVHEAAEFYPGWICRFYVTRDCSAIDYLSHMPCEIVRMPACKRRADGLYCRSGMFWRLLPIGEPGIERIIFRDTDSRVNDREAAAVREWIESDKTAHVMHDCGAHVREIMSGAWGLKGGALPQLPELLRTWLRDNGKPFFIKDDVCDERFLSEIVWPMVEGDCLAHGLRGKPFPPHRPLRQGTYVGQQIYL